MKKEVLNLFLLGYIVSALIYGLSYICLIKGVVGLEKFFVYLAIWSIFFIDFFIVREIVVLSRRKSKNGRN